MKQNDIDALVIEKLEYGELICFKMREKISAIGFDPAKEPDFKAAEFKLIIDPSTQSQDLAGIWLDAERQRRGEIKFYHDGSFYAEYDVLKRHPQKPNYYVDAIHAWGKKDAIKVEAQLLEISQ